jgi:two-component sensor histidine kinase
VPSVASRWIEAPELKTHWQLLLGAALGAAAVGLTVALDPIFGSSTRFVFFFPALTVACVLIGPIGGASCLAATSVLGVIAFIPDTAHHHHARRLWFPFLTFLASGAALIWLTAGLRATLLALRASHRQERLLIGELQHRVKNTLAIVQSIASQSLRSGATPADVEASLNERLRVLAKAHDALSETNWDCVGLKSLMARALEPFVAEGDPRLVMNGEDVMAPADQVVGLVLCFHELATNALKYGAFSQPCGRVVIAWRTRETLRGRRLELEWAESQGPRITPPSHVGFGSRILTAGLAARTRPTISLDYPPEGLRWRAEFDLGPG